MSIRMDTMLRMYTIEKTSEFSDWLSALRDLRARARIKSAEHGNLGDCEPVGEGISEMRIHVGAGYRVYFTQREKVVYLLLCGGDKSTQKRDIARAKVLRKQLEEE